MNELTYRIEPGRIDSLRWGEHDLVRRIFVTVRDRNWAEVAPSEWRCAAGEAGSQSFTARHVGEGVDFEWRGALDISREGTAIRFWFEGRTRCPMEVCRLGLVVLHPVKSLVGARLRVEGPEGAEEITIAPELHPQPIVQGLPGAMTAPFFGMSMTLPEVGSVRFTYSGDLFELEDQRNWGDASFKTYCTPLRLGFPRAIAAEQVIRQSVEIIVEEAKALRAAVKPLEDGVPERAVGGRIHRLSWSSAPPDSKLLRGRNELRFPTLGRLAARRLPLEVRDPALGYGWHHAHVDSSEKGAEEFKRTIEALPRGCALEPVVLADGQARNRDLLLETLHRYRGRIARLLVRSAQSALPKAADIVQLKSWLGNGLQGIPLLAMPNGYFVEFNRGVNFDLGVDGVAFPLSATVHSDDAGTIADNVVTVADMLQSARRLTGRMHISVSPLALYHPASTQSRFAPSLIAPWLVATLAHAASAGVDSVTLADDVVGGLCSSAEGKKILRQLLAFGGREVASVRLSGAESVHVLAVHGSADCVDVLLANLGEEGAVVILEDGQEITVAARSVIGTGLRTGRRDSFLAPF